MHCEKCGHKISSTDKFCEKCGERLEKGSSKVKVTASIEEKQKIRRWSWGGFFFGWFYLLFMRGGWLTLLFFVFNAIPVANLGALIYLGIEGRKFAWERRDWDSFDEYEDVQRKWDTWAIVLLVLSTLAGILSAWSE